MSLQDAAANQEAGSPVAKKPQYKIVVDTSILVSALFFGGNAEQALRHIVSHQHMIISDYIVDELIDFAKNTHPKTPQKLLRIIRQSLSRFVMSHESHNAEVRDVNDIAILQLAIEYGAVIVTSDKDILSHSSGAVPPVLSLEEYHQLFIQIS